jgi:hypothetical protein
VIQLPRRSVTRFFIPLIDVLILLFCIFLLMPLIGPAGEQQPAGKARPKEDEDRAADSRAKTEPVAVTRELPHQRLYIRVLEIDADSGKLFSQEGDQRVEITSAAAAERLIARHRQEAGARELYYLLLYPRRLTGYPEEGQIRQYKSWLQGVAFGTDNPRAPR